MTCLKLFLTGKKSMVKGKAQWTSSPWGFRYYDFAAYCDYMLSQQIDRICILLGSDTGLPLAIAADREQAQKAVAVCRDKGIGIAEAAALNGDHAENLEICGVLGCAYYRICNIFDDTPVVRAELIKDLQTIGDIAVDYGITVILENHGGLLAGANACRDILLETDRENVRLNFDAANFAYYGQCPYEAWTKLHDLTAFTHLKNLKPDGDKMRFCRVSEGIIDYDRLFTGFGNYSGFLGLEYEDAEDVEQGTADDLRVLREIWRKHEN